MPAKATTIDSEFNIQFISEQKTNYLSQIPPEAPQLLEINDKDFLPKGIVASLVGAGGIGKTHWLTQLAISITTGTQFLEKYSVTVAGNVFMGLGENDNDDIHRLLHKHAKKMNDDEKNLVSKRLAVMSFMGKQPAITSKGGAATPFYEKFLKALKAKEPSGGWALIILDPVSRFFGPDTETDNKAATEFIALLENITLELKGKPTVMFSHHMSKHSSGTTSTNQNASRGASGISAGSRWQANLEPVMNKDGSENLRKVGFRPAKSNFTAITGLHILEKDEKGRLMHCKDQSQSNREEQKKPTHSKSSVKKPEKPQSKNDEAINEIFNEVVLDQQTI